MRTRTAAAAAIPMARTTCAARAGISNATTTFGRRSSRCRMVIKAVATSSASTAGSSCSNNKSTISKDFYEVLSLEHSAAVGAEEIKRAYRRLALRYHPDLCPPSRRAESTELFLELRRAYETLSDPARRVRYDAELQTVATTTGGPEVGDKLFPRDVWETQLCALHARSEWRQRARNAGLGRSD